MNLTSFPRKRKKIHRFCTDCADPWPSFVDTQELKPGLVIFRRADVQHRNWYCRVKHGRQYLAKKLSSAARRCSDSLPAVDFPSGPTRRSNAINSAGVTAASLLMRLAAGWMRCNRASNESALPAATTISPSSTNRRASRAPSAATRSGRYRVIERPDLERNSIAVPSRNAKQRKPSHFGAKIAMCSSTSTTTRRPRRRPMHGG